MVVNSTLVVDSTIRLPGFDLHRRQWSLLNRFQTAQGHCNACHKKWGFYQQRTMWLWRNPDNVTHRQLLYIDQIWRRSTALTWSRSGCRRLADNIWLLAHDNNSELHKRFCGLHPDMKVSRSMFALLKPFWVLRPRMQDRDTCLCQHHENARLLHEKLKQLNALPQCKLDD